MVDKPKHFCSYECRDVGFDCDWRCSDVNEEEVIKKVENHGTEVHNKKMTPEAREKIRKLIKRTKDPLSWP